MHGVKSQGDKPLPLLGASLYHTVQQLVSMKVQILPVEPLKDGHCPIYWKLLSALKIEN